MNDMSQVIIPRSDQLNAEDFIAGPATFIIEGVAISPGTEQPVSIKLVGEPRVWRPCKSMSRVLVAAWGPDANAYVGRSVTLYRDPKVKWGGLEVGGIRVSHLSHIERDMVMSLTATKGKRAPHKVCVLEAPANDATPAGLSLDQARCDIANATTIDDLKTVWTRKSMAPHRAELQADLDARKAELTDAPNAEEGRADTDMGEAHVEETEEAPF
jgi:hypothetical protein